MNPAVQAYPLRNVPHPHPHDVLCGRGGGTNAHIGNSHWRMLVAANKELYVSLPKKQKMLLSKSIVNAVRSQSPPGRFLQKDNGTNLWYDVGDQRAQEKTSQALREGAPGIRQVRGEGENQEAPATRQVRGEGENQEAPATRQRDGENKATGEESAPTSTGSDNPNGRKKNSAKSKTKASTLPRASSSGPAPLIGTVPPPMHPHNSGQYMPYPTQPNAPVFVASGGSIGSMGSMGPMGAVPPGMYPPQQPHYPFPIPHGAMAHGNMGPSMGMAPPAFAHHASSGTYPPPTMATHTSGGSFGPPGVQILSPQGVPVGYGLPPPVEAQGPVPDRKAKSKRDGKTGKNGEQKRNKSKSPTRRSPKQSPRQEQSNSPKTVVAEVQSNPNPSNARSPATQQQQQQNDSDPLLVENQSSFQPPLPPQDNGLPSDADIPLPPSHLDDQVGCSFGSMVLTDAEHELLMNNFKPSGGDTIPQNGYNGGQNYYGNGHNQFVNGHNQFPQNSYHPQHNNYHQQNQVPQSYHHQHQPYHHQHQNMPYQQQQQQQPPYQTYPQHYQQQQPQQQQQQIQQQSQQQQSNQGMMPPPPQVPRSQETDDVPPLPIDGGLVGGVGFSFGSVMSIDEPKLDGGVGLSMGSAMSCSVRGDAAPVDGGLEAIGTSFGSMSLGDQKPTFDGGVGTSFGSMFSINTQERDKLMEAADQLAFDDDDVNVQPPTFQQKKSKGSLLECDSESEEEESEAMIAQKSLNWEKLQATIAQQRIPSSAKVEPSFGVRRVQNEGQIMPPGLSSSAFPGDDDVDIDAMPPPPAAVRKQSADDLWEDATAFGAI